MNLNGSVVCATAFLEREIATAMAVSMQKSMACSIDGIANNVDPRQEVYIRHSGQSPIRKNSEPASTNERSRRGFIHWRDARRKVC